MGARSDRWVFRSRRSQGSGRSGLLLLAFVSAYALAEAIVALSIADAPPFYPVGLGLLVLLGAGVFLASLREGRRPAQQFFLALSILPCLTIARLALSGLSEPVLGPLLVYLLLAVAVLTFRQSTGARLDFGHPNRRQLLRSLALGVVLAAGVVLFGFVLLVPGPSLPALVFSLPLAVLPPVALLDELWFRGFLQGGIAPVASRGWGWVATAALFAAYGAPFASPVSLAFRAGYGAVLGALAMRRENLAVALVARVALAAGLALLVPGVAGTSLLV